MGPEALVPSEHALRAIRPLVNGALEQLSSKFEALYAHSRRTSSAPGKLLRALLLQPSMAAARADRTGVAGAHAGLTRRLPRSLKDLLLILDKVEKAGAHFRSLTENIDSTTASRRMMMQMLGAFAEFERATGFLTSQGGFVPGAVCGLRTEAVPRSR